MSIDLSKMDVQLCRDCGECVHLKDAGFDVETHPCAMCGQHVASKEEFFNIPVELMSK